MKQKNTKKKEKEKMKNETKNSKLIGVEKLQENLSKTHHQRCSA